VNWQMDNERKVKMMMMKIRIDVKAVFTRCSYKIEGCKRKIRYIKLNRLENSHKRSESKSKNSKK